MTQPSKSPAGVLQISAAVTQKGTSSSPKKAPKPPSQRLKLIIRRLPPGLTRAEFVETLGLEWTAGAGKVDWLEFKAGKVSKDAAKPSRPSRAYIHVTSNEHITPLSDHVRQLLFQDARNTMKDPILLGPPILEFSPYAKIPGNGSRNRKDAREGTIDQDPEFIAFLDKMTQPISKATPVDNAEGDEKKRDKKDKVTTPLVQFLRDKKASKAKDSAASKSSRNARSEKESKPEKIQAKKLLQRSDKEVAAPTAEKKGKGDKTSKESGKAAKQATVATSKSGKASTPSINKETATPALPERKRERGSVAVAKTLIQRDLQGSSSPGGRRRGKGGATETVSPNAGSPKTNSPKAATPKNGSPKTGSPKTANSRDSSALATDKPKKELVVKAGKKTLPGASSTKGKEKENEAVSIKAHETSNAPPPNTNSTTNATPKSSKANKSKPAAAPSPTATQAFLKYLNPSQGVTEASLAATFSPFGAVIKTEIDKKKGFGYVDFADPSALQKAIAASPVTVAQCQVVVLERKANPGGKAQPGSGSSHRNRGGRGRNKGPKGGNEAAPSAAET
ncbi:hypothetical protein N7495_006562 [Penicillium taxi]|uniref:uncharacterized protein n=1 Tax=Penicillium taxi TaxID=168475 RepID=UPI002545B7ED|nr:uncharacterized protein N7495_006562 [Penicillium taxi]KAJ5894871.1 hypothetical protein N7495_006562 [Penicillium taxi]